MRTGTGNMRFVISLMMSLIVTSVMAQLFSPPSSILQRANIGLVDEFMKRFNGEEVHPELKSEGEQNRKENLICLFNFDQFAGKGDSIKSEIETMISTVISDSIRIDYADSRWFAQAMCKGSLDGKEVTFTIFLNVESRGDDMYKWVISSVDGRLFDISPEVHNENIMLYPDDHETKFISLARMSKEQPKNVELFMNRDFRYDPTSVYAFLVYTNRLKIEYVKDLEFIFTQVPEYMFSIKYFHRESSNSGWLINDMWRANDRMKSEYLTSLNIYPRGTFEQDNGCLSNTLDNTDVELLTTRTDEYIELMKDYIAFIHSVSGSSQSIESYKRKISDLFIPEFKVHINNGEELSDVAFEEFYDKYLLDANIILSLDSLQIPVLISKDQLSETDSDILYVPSSIMDLHTGTYSNLSREKQLFYKKESTEDGNEWIPLFGDLFVTIKKN